MKTLIFILFHRLTVKNWKIWHKLLYRQTQVRSHKVGCVFLMVIAIDSLGPNSARGKNNMVLAHLISKIYDQYSNFVSLEDQLFILRHQNRDQICYYNLNRNNITEEEMNSAVDHIVDG